MCNDGVEEVIGYLTAKGADLKKRFIFLLMNPILAESIFLSKNYFMTV